MSQPDKAYLSGENLLPTLAAQGNPLHPFQKRFRGVKLESTDPTMALSQRFWTGGGRIVGGHTITNRAEFHNATITSGPNVETTVHKNQGEVWQRERLRSKTLTAQITEALCKVLLSINLLRGDSVTA
jgi:hypothetical protein